ncbi:MAG TPA: transcription elongation factor GreA [Anaerolineales bacterium]|nr:transcription elongation factor GreA [Anaerolineales bacterium]
MSDQTYLTTEGASQLRAELAELKGPKRLELAQRLRSAIQMGDLSENADYHKAKEDQGFLEGRINDLEYLLNHATIVDVSEVSRDSVQVGTRVTIQEAGEEPESYQMVGASEADPPNGRISNESPIGQALFGKKVGEIAVAKTPGGEITFKIIKIE